MKEHHDSESDLPEAKVLKRTKIFKWPNQP